MSNVSALAGLWPQFQSILSDPSATLSIPAGGLKLANGTTITEQQLAQIQALVKESVGPQAFLYQVVSKSDPASSEAQDLSKTIAQMQLPAGFQLHVAGETANDRDFFSALSGRLPWVAAWIAVTTFIILLFCCEACSCR